MGTASLVQSNSIHRLNNIINIKIYKGKDVQLPSEFFFYPQNFIELLQFKNYVLNFSKYIEVMLFFQKG